MKRTKKVVRTFVRAFVCSCLGFMLLIGTVSASSTTEWAYLTTSTSSASSAAVGLGTEAKFYGYCYSSSTGSMKMKCNAAWNGYPYTTEATHTIKPGQSDTVTDTQTKSSSFKVGLSGGKTTCSGYGSVTVLK